LFLAPRAAARTVFRTALKCRRTSRAGKAWCPPGEILDRALELGKKRVRDIYQSHISFLRVFLNMAFSIFGPQLEDVVDQI
jgi:hypothetical protein